MTVLRPRWPSKHAFIAGPMLAWAFAAAHAQPTLQSGIDHQHADPSVRAQDDLFRHTNGQWLKTTPIPADRPRVGSFISLDDETRVQLRTLIEQAGSQGPGNAIERQINDFYASFMDEALLERLGGRPLAAELARIDGIDSKAALPALFARLGRLGAAVPLEVWIDQDARRSTRYVPILYQSGLGLPDRDYYLKLDDARFADVRVKYAAYLQRLLTRAGVTDTQNAGARILALETGIAAVQWTRVETRDSLKTYNRTDISALPAMASQIDWKAFLAEAGVAGLTPDVVVEQPSYISGLGRLLETTPLADWKLYAQARLLDAYAPLLSVGFVDEQFAFSGGVLEGTTQKRPRWERGVSVVQDSLGEAVGQLYVARYFPPAQKARMEALVANLMAAYRDSIAGLTWMGPETRREAQAKLAAMSLKIGHPRRWIDYSSVVVKPGDLVGNVMRAREFNHARQVAWLGRPVDRELWRMTPQTVNAYYNPSLNEIVFPAAILQPPFFNAQADDAVNYGGIGAVIGHEISHGFDDQGSRYDAEGNLRDWWQPEDRARFAERALGLVAQYGRYVSLPGYPLNGQQTLGENIADNAGLAIAYKAYRLSLNGKEAPVIDGMTGNQRFFYGWAQIWRVKARDAFLLQQIKSGQHSPGEFRANGTVRNHPGYYDAFGVRPGDALHLPPEQRLSIW